MTVHHLYPIGTQGQAWGVDEKALWLSEQRIQRHYAKEVLPALQQLPAALKLQQYGELDYRIFGAGCYPLFAVLSQQWQADRPTVLITGGVHGYESSGVHGALRFISSKAAQYAGQVNVLVAPCISPWGYETINRWTPLAVDPNRAFVANSPAQESALLMQFIAKAAPEVLLHIDLHETTDSDNSEFRPAKAARDGTVNTNWNIPDGFYLVGDSANPQPAFQQAIIKAVAKVTHIAPADEQGQLIGETLAQPGVVNYPKKALGLCGGMTKARYVTTTEVYPDSQHTNAEQCIEAQVTAICAAVDFVIANA
ncbi:M14 family metallopeptidase [Arsukibacterium sp.]|uniref:M14 family metallopeptidase n=1 Tax=Arsukibacterium sp. TaxID=1977258 RepID=UPI002FDA7150